MRTVELRVLCEGPTEQNFVIKVLHAHLAAFGVYARPQSLTPRGFGVVPFEKLYKDIKNEVGRSKSHQFVTTMIDLYGLNDYPDAAALPGETGAARARRIETRMAEHLPSPQFIPHIQVYEFEALVLAGLGHLDSQFPDGDAVGAAEKIRDAIGDFAPEDVDDGAATAPSKRIIHELPAYEHRKAVAGPEIAARIGIADLREACPHFGAWVQRLEQLGEAGE